jgi:hypothetical protein
MKIALIVLGSAVMHLVLPAFFLIWTALARHKSRAQFLSIAALTGAYVLCLGLAGAAWPWFGLWWPWLWYVSLPIACCVWIVRRWSATPAWPERKIWPMVSVAFNGLIALLLSSTIPEIRKASRYDGEPLALEPPLGHGSIVVGHGGSTVILNYHVVVPAQRYALDILGLDGTTRADGLLPEALTAYAIWSRPVIAPCAGTVVAVENALPDGVPGIPNAPKEQAAGNHVVLRCGAYHVVLAHLQRGSVVVEPGASVGVGILLGRVGNSGNTSEPHLHIHALRGDVADREQLLWKGNGVPITFRGRFLVRGDTAEW